MTPLIRFGDETVARAIEAMQTETRGRGLAAIFAVADAHGDLMGFLRMDGAALSSIDVAINKAFSSARTGTSTKAIGAAWRDPASAFDVAYYGTGRIVGWGGGLPVRHQGEVVGAAAVSGLTEELDEEIAGIAVELILREIEGR